MFYLDIGANILDENVKAAMRHLEELATFVRVFGSYPIGGVLVHARQQVLPFLALSRTNVILPPAPAVARGSLRIAIVGFGNFGQVLELLRKFPTKF